jgi:hypothetical protein
LISEPIVQADRDDDPVIAPPAMIGYSRHGGAGR